MQLLFHFYIFAFAGKGISLYFARSIVIVLGNRIKQRLKNKMTDNILLSDLKQSKQNILENIYRHFYMMSKWFKN